MRYVLCLIGVCTSSCVDTPAPTPAALSSEDCGNGIDDDGDGLSDCEDADCAGIRVCDELDCADGMDDDGDGLIDCDDDDCWSLEGCRVELSFTYALGGITTSGPFEPYGTVNHRLWLDEGEGFARRRLDNAQCDWVLQSMEIGYTGQGDTPARWTPEVAWIPSADCGSLGIELTTDLMSRWNATGQEARLGQRLRLPGSGPFRYESDSIVRLDATSTTDGFTLRLP